MPEQNPLPFPEPPARPATAGTPAAPVDAPAARAPADGPALTPGQPAAQDAAATVAQPLAQPLAGPRPGPRARRPLWARLLGRLADPWLDLKLEPADLDPYAADPRPVCYVLEDYGLSNALILDKACRQAGLPSPLVPLPRDPTGRKRAYVALSRRNAAPLIPDQRPAKRTHSDSLARLLQAHRADPALDVRLVPVSIFVGRAPDRQSGWFSVLFSGNWALVGRFRRLLRQYLQHVAGSAGGAESFRCECAQCF